MSGVFDKKGIEIKLLEKEPETTKMSECEGEFVIITKKDIELLDDSNEVCKDSGAIEDVKSILELTACSNLDENRNLNESNEEDETLFNNEGIVNQILKLEKDFEHWTNLRRDTISKLREIADYIGE